MCNVHVPPKQCLQHWAAFAAQLTPLSQTPCCRTAGSCSCLPLLPPLPLGSLQLPPFCSCCTQPISPHRCLCPLAGHTCSTTTHHAAPLPRQCTHPLPTHRLVRALPSEWVTPFSPPSRPHRLTHLPPSHQSCSWCHPPLTRLAPTPSHHAPPHQPLPPASATRQPPAAHPPQYTPRTGHTKKAALIHTVR